MSRLKTALQREYEDNPNTMMEIHNPRNTVAVELYFRGEKTAKVMGSLAMETPKSRQKLSGVMVKRNFNHCFLAPSDLPAYVDTDINPMNNTHKIHFHGSVSVLKHLLTQIDGDLDIIDDKKMRVLKNVDVTIEGKVVTMEWIGTPVNDMYADSVLVALLQADMMMDPAELPTEPTKMDRIHFKECLVETLQDMFGEDSVPKIFKGEKFDVTVDNKKAHIDLSTLEVTSEDDDILQQTVQTVMSKLHQSLAPPSETL
ncbi:hypothetical protein PV325_013022 [Microctonus aethiopoides]|nr:hypothetical protein PV325_013022 [Microctonus aethiopoides]